MTKGIFTTILGVLIWFSMNAQDSQSNYHISNIIEGIVEDIEDENERAELIEDLEYYSINPICLFYDDLSLLTAVNVISQKQLESVLKYMSANNVLSIYELQYIDGFDLQTMKRIIPFVILDCKQKSRSLSFSNALKYGRSTVFLRTQRVFEESLGYANDSSLTSGYPGSREKVYLRANFNYSNMISFGFTGEKDEGEEFKFDSTSLGFDYNSLHFQYRNSGIIKQINLGDYKSTFGQGLCFNTGYRPGRLLTNSTSIDKVSPGIQKYTSVEENNFLRGVGIVLGNENLVTSVFLSSKNRDANLVRDESDSIIGFSGLVSGGLHNTELLLNKKKSVRERIFGVDVQYRFTRLHLGVIYSRVEYNYDNLKSESAYNIYDIGGRRFSNLGFYYRTRIGDVNLFGEIAYSDNGTLATINGLILWLSGNSSFIIVSRYYPPEYLSSMGNSFGRSTNNNNEKGIYSAIEFTPLSNIKISAWIDFTEKPWLSYNLNLPTSEISNALQIVYPYKDNNQIYLRFKYSSQFTKDSEIESGTDKPLLYKKANLRLHNDFYVSSSISLRNRVEVTNINETENKKGWLIYQDIKYKSAAVPFTLSCRFAIFDTDDWESRIYSWEHDVLYSYSLPAHYMKGTRSYLLLSWEINKHIKLWGRISRTSYYNMDVIGSGLTEIAGNKKTDAKVLLRIKF